MVGKIYVGTGGWTFAPWRGTFYPKGVTQARELEYASRQLTSIEINGTYYGSQKPASFTKWYDETPDDFIFSLKGPRFATNRKVLADSAPSIEKFFASGITNLKQKLGPINWQFMATKKFDAEDFEGFLKLLPQSHEGIDLRHAVEVRHDSFACPEFVALARNYNVSTIIAQHEKFPQIADLTAPFVYMRLQTGTADEPLGYSNEELQLIAKNARLWAKGGTPKDNLKYADKPETGKSGPRDVFIYMIAGHKEHNPAAAQALIALLQE